MMNRNINSSARGRCTDDELGRTVDEIVGLFLELQESSVPERRALRRKLAAAGYRLNRLATRQRAA